MKALFIEQGFLVLDAVELLINLNIIWGLQNLTLINLG